MIGLARNKQEESIEEAHGCPIAPGNCCPHYRRRLQQGRDHYDDVYNYHRSSPGVEFDNTNHNPSNHVHSGNDDYSSPIHYDHDNHNIDNN
jgi:hypothetical protein